MLNWKNSFTLVLLALFMLISGACAESLVVESASADRIYGEIYDGMVLNKDSILADEDGVVKFDGYIEITIDTEATDWQKAFFHGLDPRSGEVSWGPSLEGPGGYANEETWEDYYGAVYGQWFGTSDGGDSDILQTFENEYMPSLEEVQNDACEFPWATNRVPIGRYSASTGMFEPQPVKEHYLAARWFDADGNIIRIEKVQLVVNFTSTEPIPVEMEKYPAEDNTYTDYGMFPSEYVECVVSDGAVQYHIREHDSSSAWDISTYVLYPDASVTEFDENNPIFCAYTLWGDGGEVSTSTVYVDGQPRLGAQVCQFNSAQPFSEPWIAPMTVKWYTRDPETYEESIITMGTLNVSAMALGSDDGYVTYADPDRVRLDCPDGLSAQLVPDGDFYIIKIDEENSDWELVAQTAEFTEEGMIILPIEIAAPAGATRNAGFGTSETDDQRLLEMIREEWANEGTTYRNGWEIGRLEGGIFEKNEFNDAGMCVQWSNDAGCIIATEKIFFGTIPCGNGDDDGGNDMVELPVIDPEGQTVVNLGLNEGDADRVGALIPKGMVATFEFDDSAEDPSQRHWVLTIDNDATDWETVFKYAYDAEMNWIGQGFVMFGPENAVYRRSTGTSLTDDYELLTMLNEYMRDEGWVGNSDRNSWELGSYVTGVNMFQPTVNSRGMCVMVAQWFDENKELISTEKFMFKIQFTNTDPTRVDFNYIPAEQIRMYTDVYEDYDNVTTTVSNGYARYNVPAADEGIDLTTWLICPVYLDDDDTNDDVNMDDWSCVQRDGTDTWDHDLEWLEYGDYCYLAAQVYDNWLDCSQEKAYTGSMNLTWYQNIDGEQVEMQHGVMQHMVQIGDPLPWPDYVDEWTAVGSDQVTDIVTVNAVDGLSATYADGVLLMGVEDDKLPSAADLSKTSFSVKINPPDDRAVYYRENRSSGNNIFDYDSWTVEDQMGLMPYKPLRTIESDPMVLNIHPCNKYTSQITDDLTLSIYLSRDATPEYGGAVNLIYWYDADMNLLDMQWIVERYEPIMRAVESASYNEESEITSVLELPVIVVFEKGGRYNKYSLRIVSYPQEGSDYVYYDLTLIDKNGNEVELADIDKLDNKRCKIYIPYPDGYDMDSNVKYNIHHLNSKHHAKEYFSEDNQDFMVYRTEYGLCIEVNSLSPFVLSWEGAPAAIEMVLPANLARINDQAFLNGVFEVIRIPDGCSYIGNEAFKGVTNLTVYMPENTSLELSDTAFEWDSVTLVLPESSAEYIQSIVPENCNCVIVSAES